MLSGITRERHESTGVLLLLLELCGDVWVWDQLCQCTAGCAAGAVPAGWITKVRCPGQAGMCGEGEPGAASTQLAEPAHCGVARVCFAARSLVAFSLQPL